jgi:hypothetical protein
MSSPEIQRYAQKLVDNTIELNRLKSDVKELRYTVVMDAEDEPIVCDGGTVYFRDAQEKYPLKRDKLRQNLMDDFNLTEKEVDDLFEGSKSMVSVFPTAFVKLDS